VCLLAEKAAEIVSTHEMKSQIFAVKIISETDHNFASGKVLTASNSNLHEQSFIHQNRDSSD
jgi:hypothetical protein